MILTFSDAELITLFCWLLSFVCLCRRNVSEHVLQLLELILESEVCYQVLQFLILHSFCNSFAFWDIYCIRYQKVVVDQVLNVRFFIALTVLVDTETTTAMQANRRGGGGGRGGGSYSRDGSRNMRHSPEYAPYQGGRDSGRDRGRDRSPRYSPYRSHARDRSASPQYASYRRWSLRQCSPHSFPHKQLISLVQL